MIECQSLLGRLADLRTFPSNYLKREGAVKEA